MKKIFVRSPYFVQIDEPNQLSGSIELYIWNKNSTEPIDPNYTLSKDIPTANQPVLSWNISNYALEFIKPIKTTTVSVPTEEDVNTWCYMRVVSYSDGEEVADETYVCLNGYTNYSIGYNQNNTDTIIPLVNIDINLTTFSGFNYINVWIEENDTFEYSSSHSTEFFTTVSEGIWKLPYDYDPYTLGYDGGANIFTFNSEEVCEPKYTPITCTYINRYGGWQFLTFFKASSELIDTEYKEFNLMPSNVDYDPYLGVNKVFNNQGKQTIKCNTGWVDENYFELIQDLLLSETILLDNKPVTIKSKSMDKKTYIKDKNINYTIDFQYAFGLINDIM
jgi:hypothetical protein